MDNDRIAAAKSIAPYLLECLVWNLPNNGLGHDTYSADVRYALAYVFNSTMTFDNCKEWGEVNELKYLYAYFSALDSRANTQFSIRRLGLHRIQIKDEESKQHS